MAIRVSLASVPEVDGVWPRVSEGLGRACRNTGGDLTAQYLWSECRSGRAFLAVVIDGGELLGASVWRFEEWSSGRKLKCLALYGERMDEWLSTHREFSEHMARAGGASAIVTEGRMGWKRLFPEARIVRQVYEVEMK